MVVTNKKAIKLFLATPMYGGMCYGLYAQGVVQMVSVCLQNNITLMYSCLTNESLITRGRNSLANDFMKTDCTHLMFIDSDIGFNPADIIPMIKADKDIICGLCTKKEINWPRVEQAVRDGVPMNKLYDHTGVLVVNLLDDATSATGEIDEPIQIANGGTGFMLVNRKVFEVLSTKVPEYKNEMYSAADINPKREFIKEYFATSIDKNLDSRLLSEDYHFCKIARDQGFTVWAAPWAKLIHCGYYNYNSS